VTAPDLTGRRPAPEPVPSFDMGRNLHAGQVDRWSSAWFHDQGLYKLMGTIRYPKAA